jgi:hypothetical protein
MTVSTETHTALAAMGSRILAAPSVFPQDHPLNDIYRDLSWTERKRLEAIVKAKRAGTELVLDESNITELKMLQERIFDKHQTDPFVATELKALADCTGVERREITSVSEKGESNGSGATHPEEPDPFAEDDSWGNSPWKLAAHI